MFRMPRRRCLDFGAGGCEGWVSGASSRCEACRRRRRAVRDADRQTARKVVEASPVCVGCGATDDLTADHVVPLARGGRHDGHRQVLCRPCNSRKGAR